jgi:hypothetical protein
MKNNSWKKEWLVISHSDYNNTWYSLTIPLTFKQASKFVRHGQYLNRYEKGTIKIVTLNDSLIEKNV